MFVFRKMASVNIVPFWFGSFLQKIAIIRHLQQTTSELYLGAMQVCHFFSLFISQFIFIIIFIFSYFYLLCFFFLCGLSTGQNVYFPVTANSPFSVHPPSSYIDLVFSSYEHELLTTHSLFHALLTPPEWGSGRGRYSVIGNCKRKI